MSGTQVLPLRPMTVGELLDAAATLLRAHWKPLLAGSFGLAAVEQVIMTWMRLSTQDALAPRYSSDLFGEPTVLWLWMIAGLTTEILIITVLGVPASRAALATVLDRPAPGFAELYVRGVPWGRVVVVAVIIAPVAALTAAMCGLPWFVVYAFGGLIVPVLIIDGAPLGTAIGRGLALAGRAGCRAAGVRLLGYGSWLLVRLAITCGAWSAADQIASYSSILEGNLLLVLGGAYLAINTMAYAMLACLDAVTLIETRIRTEGLDIVLTRAAARGDAPNLAPPRMLVYPPHGGPPR
ncbi:hypothetical protein [Phytomonospora endophytica]|uniref:Transmembrane protein n=1 Tax=Phytomonospora endophytica TaxID=714109 RepID=A0A841G4I0_9ACTN|nr:hypothetical protein [Phytomonospora endophytica]MBB6039639.1 hypothetical protein [Phytomonospora endophytica]GIG65642.1 hypothetical protein Pen01_19370 [Phytomonospora endophytica]